MLFSENHVATEITELNDWEHWNIELSLLFSILFFIWQEIWCKNLRVPFSSGKSGSYEGFAFNVTSSPHEISLIVPPLMIASSLDGLTSTRIVDSLNKMLLSMDTWKKYHKSIFTKIYKIILKFSLVDKIKYEFFT